MVFLSAEDFFRRVDGLAPLSPGEKEVLFAQMQAGDTSARERLVQAYLPFAASYIRRAPRRLQTLSTVYACVACVEKSVDSFDPSRSRREFAHRLGWRLRQCITRCLAEK